MRFVEGSTSFKVDKDRKLQYPGRIATVLLSQALDSYFPACQMLKNVHGLNCHVELYFNLTKSNNKRLLLVVCKLCCTWKLLENFLHLILSDSEHLRSRNGNLITLSSICHCIDSPNNLTPNTGAVIFYNRVVWVLFTSSFEHWFSVHLKNLVCVICPSAKH